MNDFDVFYRAAQSVLHGQSPYTLNFFNPGWALLFIMPLTLFPLSSATALWCAASFAGIVVALRRFRVAWSRIALWLIASPLGLVMLLWGNLDWLCILGATLPPVVGIWLVMLKPQIGIVVALVWVYQAWRARNWRGLILLTVPISLMLIAQLAVWGIPRAVGLPSVATVWPWGVLLVALGLMTRRLRVERIPDALLIAPLLSPYVNPISWSAALPWLCQRGRRATLILLVAAWIVFAAWWWIGRR